MSIYCIEHKKMEKYEAVVYATSYRNPFEEIGKIEMDISNQIPNGGFILFDMLLSNGDSFNRFAEAYFDGNKIQKDTITVVDMEKPLIKSINEFYKGKAVELDNSVLTQSEKMKYCNS